MGGTSWIWTEQTLYVRIWAEQTLYVRIGTEQTLYYCILFLQFF